MKNDGGVLLTRAKIAVNCDKINNELMEISEKYSSLADNLKSTISENFIIHDANIMLNEMYF